MRTQSEAPLHPVLPTDGVPSDISDLPPGKLFSARIQEVLPDNTYKALVAGRQLTLALPQGAKAGDLLELVVIDRSARVVVAQLANAGADGVSAPPYEFTNLSRAGQLIGSLLGRNGEAPPSVALTRGQALLAEVPTDGKQLASNLAPQLAKAVGESGLFYESHQVQWANGQRPLGDLLAEPQGKFSSPATLEEHLPKAADIAADVQPKSGADATGRPAATGALALLQTLLGIEPGQAPKAPEPPVTPNPAQTLPEELRPIVQQQLDAATTQRMAWHGDVWPQQPMQWEIQKDGRSAQEHDGEARGWTSSLRLTTPRLGEIDARINFTGSGVRITVATAMDRSASDLRNAIPALEGALAAAGVPLLSLKVNVSPPPRSAELPKDADSGQPDA